MVLRDLPQFQQEGDVCDWAGRDPLLVLRKRMAAWSEPASEEYEALETQVARV